MTGGGISPRPLGRGELDELVGWAAGEGWDPGPGDAGAFWAADPDAFRGFDRDGSLAGGIAAVAYGSGVGFLGLFIVRPELRSRGLGRELWLDAIARLRARIGDSAPIGLDGVEDMQPFYERDGFVKAHDTARMQTEGSGADPGGLAPLGEIPFAELLAYDTRCFGVSREPFLRAWLGLEGAVGLAAAGSSGLGGYGVVRPTRGGAKIGPLFAEDPDTAERLLRGLLAAMPGVTVSFDVPEANAASAELARRFGMRETFRTARMWAGEPPPIPWSSVFGVTTLELG